MRDILSIERIKEADMVTMYGEEVKQHSVRVRLSENGVSDRFARTLGRLGVDLFDMETYYVQSEDFDRGSVFGTQQSNAISAVYAGCCECERSCIELSNGFRLIEDADGSLIIALSLWRIYDYYEFDMERDWMLLKPVLGWFMSL